MYLDRLNRIDILPLCLRPPGIPFADSEDGTLRSLIGKSPFGKIQQKPG